MLSIMVAENKYAWGEVGHVCLVLIFGKFSRRFTRDFTNTDYKKKSKLPNILSEKNILTENPLRFNLEPRGGGATQVWFG